MEYSNRARILFESRSDETASGVRIMETMEITKTKANHNIFNEPCLAWGTQLMTPEGMKPIDSLQTAR
jgi:hypothetical protein